MYKKNMKFTAVLIMLSILLSGCNAGIKQAAASKVSSSSPIEATIHYLTSDECDGRLIGTAGNKKAQEYVVKKFEEYLIKPFNGSYYHPYSQEVINLKENILELKLDDSKKDSKNLEYGKDYIERSLSRCKLELPLHIGNDINEDCILVTEDIIDPNIKNDKVKAALVVSEKLLRGSISPNRLGSKCVFSITPKVYEQLKKADKAYLSLDYSIDEITENNVAGVLEGHNSNKAVVIMAHIDHVGSIGNTIWRGAVDNGSGVALMMDMVNKLAQYAKSNKLGCDIVFCAVNGEETFLNGSRAFAEEIYNRYGEVTNINIDCVGEKGKDAVYVDADIQSSESENLAKYLSEHFKQSGFKSEVASGKYTSDHYSFSVGINVTTGYNFDLIHTVDDTADKLDTGFMEKISDALTKFVTEYIDKELENEPDQISRIIKEEKERLDFGQYKFVEADGELLYIHNGNFKGSLEEANKLLGSDDLSFIPAELNGLPLKEISINAFKSKFVDTPPANQHEPGKVYNHKNILSQFNNMSICYYGESKLSEISVDKYLTGIMPDMDWYKNQVENKISNAQTIGINNKRYYIIKPEMKGEFHILAYIDKHPQRIYFYRIAGTDLEKVINDKSLLSAYINDNHMEDLIDNISKWLNQQ